MLTPLDADERVDETSLRRLVDFLVGAGVHGVWAMGTTGEFAGIAEAERARAIQATVDEVAGRVPVIANIGDSSTGLARMPARARQSSALFAQRVFRFGCPEDRNAWRA